MRSICSSSMPRLRVAMPIERASLSRSNGARRPSFLTTSRSRSWTRSKVVKRAPQTEHWRRRRIAAAVLDGPRILDLGVFRAAERAAHPRSDRRALPGRRTIAAARLDRAVSQLSTRRWCRPPSNAVSRNAAEAVDRDAGADHARTQDQHVGVVVLAGEAGGGDVVAQGGADMAVPVGGDADADAGAADQDAAPRPAVAQRGGQRVGHVGIVDRAAVVGAEIEHLEPAALDARREAAASAPPRHDRRRARRSLLAWMAPRSSARL